MEDMWQRNASLADTNLRMFDNEIMCDVTFLAGESRQEIKAHKYMLVCRSPVFFAMFCGAMAETSDVILVPDIEANILKILLRHMYTVVPEVTAETVTSLMYAAHKYDITTLVTACRDYLKLNITPENVCTILEQAIAYDDTELLKHCKQTIEDETDAVLDSAGFLALAHTCLKYILNMERLCAFEDHVYTSCVKWAKQECKRRGMEENDAGCREVLGDIVHMARFPRMSLDNFTALASNTNNGNKSTEEKDETVPNEHRQLSSPERPPERPPSLFSDANRKQKIVVNRFGKIHTGRWHGDGTDDISFSCSHDATLTGVGVFVPCTKINERCGSLRLYKEDKFVGQTYVVQENIPIDRVVYVRFRATPIEKDVWYKLVQVSNGQLHAYGDKGEESVRVNGFTVTFSKSAGTSSDVSRGQIPCLYFEH